MIAGCSAGKTECVVTSCGDIIPCDMFPRKPPYIAGNMRKQTFEQIWENAKIFHDLRAVTQESLNGKCFDCRFKSICVGGCRATALHEYGHFNTPDPLCPHDPEKDQRLIIQ